MCSLHDPHSPALAWISTALFPSRLPPLGSGRSAATPPADARAPRTPGSADPRSAPWESRNLGRLLGFGDCDHLNIADVQSGYVWLCQVQWFVPTKIDWRLKCSENVIIPSATMPFVHPTQPLILNSDRTNKQNGGIIYTEFSLTLKLIFILLNTAMHILQYKRMSSLF